MRKILREAIKPIINFFSQIIDKEARRVNEFNDHILGAETNDNTRPYRIGRCPLLQKEVKVDMEYMSTIRRDFVASNLRSQLVYLQTLSGCRISSTI